MKCRKRPCPRPCPRPCRRRGEVELFGLILLIIGVVTLCAFILPSKLWLLILGGLMIYCGFKLFVC